MNLGQRSKQSCRSNIWNSCLRKQSQCRIDNKQSSIRTCLRLGKNEMSSQPNIIYVFSDQQHYEPASAFGNNELKTPAMDRLCKEGIQFTECHATHPICGPSRSSLFTGRMPCKNGVHTNGNNIIIYMSDHDERLGEHGLVTKGSPYEESVRLPLIVRWPEKIKPNGLDKKTQSSHRK